jgi:RsiW-degrading membrane proteinase PrsW (M82 family)
MCKLNNNHMILFCNEFSTWMVFTTSKDGHIVTYHAGYSEQIMIMSSVRFDKFSNFSLIGICLLVALFVLWFRLNMSLDCTFLMGYYF